MSREAFERIHCGGNARITRRNEHGDYVSPAIQDAWAGWQAARAAALEEAAEVCERIGPVMAERYGPGAECITTADECADAIRALKEPQ